MKKVLLFLFLLVGSTTRVSAIPAYPGWLKHTQPDGTVVTYQLLGDEYCHSMVSANGRLLQLNPDGWLIEKPDAKGQTFGQYYQKHAGMSHLRQGVLGNTFPTVGTVKGLVLLVEFSDNSFNEEYTCEVFQDMMNVEGYSDFNATGSSRDYFMDQSMGQFTPDFDVYGPVKLSGTIKYYGQNNSRGEDMRPELMVKEACTLAHDSLEVDFSQYDCDDNGDLDFVYIIYAGYAESYGAPSYTIWPHASTITSLNFYLDGKRVTRYACSSELKYTTGSKLEGIGTFCHEFGHVLGLPDMYNTYMSSDTQLGPWDVMDTGSYNNESHTPPAYSAFERYSLGWLTFTDIDTPSDEMTLEELTVNNVAYRIRTKYENEYFTLENRQRVGWDAYQPGKGLMIIHVNYNEQVWNNNGVNSGLQPCYDLVEADNRDGHPSADNLYPNASNDMFTDYSTPNSLAWDGTPTEKGVSNIHIDDGVVKFRFMRDRLQRPTGLTVSEVGTTTARISWEPVDMAAGYELTVREVLPDSLNPIYLKEDFSLMEKGNYPNGNYQNISDKLDEYTLTPGWSGTEIYQAGGYAQVGRYGTDGKITTPAFTLDEWGDSIFVYFHAVSYPGKSLNYELTVIDGETGQAIESLALKATKNETERCFELGPKCQKVKLSFNTQKERLFLNDLIVLRDTLSGIWDSGPKTWSIDSISDSEYLLEDLVPNRTYYCCIRALATGGMTSSPFTEELMFTTLGQDNAIIAVPDTRPADEAWYTLGGMRLLARPTQKGIYIHHGRKVVI